MSFRILNQDINSFREASFENPRKERKSSKEICKRSLPKGFGNEFDPKVNFACFSPALVSPKKD
jgi:hypothetical protein